MFASIAGFGLPMRHPRVHVPVFPDSSLPGVDRITEAGHSTYKALAGDRFQQRLRRGRSADWKRPRSVRIRKEGEIVPRPPAALPSRLKEARGMAEPIRFDDSAAYEQSLGRTASARRVW
jgi:hypothetical protein